MLNRVMLGVVLAALATLASSQSRRATEVELRWSVDGGSVEAAVRADLDGLLVGLGGVTDVQARLGSLERLRASGVAATEQAVEQLGSLFKRRVRLRFDGSAAPIRVDFPDRRDRDGVLETLGAVAVVSAVVPANARDVSFFASRAFRGVSLRNRLSPAPLHYELEPGERSVAMSLSRD